RGLFGQSDDRVADLDISVDDFPARVGVAVQFNRAERPLIKLNGLGRASDEHTWRYSVEAFWYWFPIAFHMVPPLGKIEGDHFVKVDGRYRQAYNTAGLMVGRRFSADEEMRLADATALRRANAYLLRRRRDDFTHRPFHRHGVGQIHEMSGD